MANLRSGPYTPQKRGRGRPPKSLSDSQASTANSSGTRSKAKLSTRGVTRKSSRLQNSSPGSRTQSSDIEVVSVSESEDDDSEEAEPTSLSKTKLSAQVRISNDTHSRNKKTTQQSIREQETGKTLVQQTRAQARELAAMNFPKVDRVDWYDQRGDGTRWHMWRILIRNCWPGQEKGEGIVFDRGEELMYEDEEDADEVMEDDEDNKDMAAEASIDTNQVIIRDFALEPSDNLAFHDAIDDVPGQLEEGSTAEPNSKVEHTAPLFDFEIFTENDAEEASQAQGNYDAQEVQGETTAMNANMVNGRAVLMPLELTGPHRLALPHLSTSITDGTTSTSNPLAMSTSRLSSSPVISEGSGIIGDGNQVLEGSDSSEKENLNGLFTNEVVQEFAQGGLPGDEYTTSTDAQYEMAANLGLSVSAFQPSPVQEVVEGAQEDLHDQFTQDAAQSSVVGSTTEELRAQIGHCRQT